jgi:hypothetical protein
MLRFPARILPASVLPYCSCTVRMRRPAHFPQLQAGTPRARWSTHVSFKLDPRSLGQVDADGKRVILPGEYTVFLGGSQPDAGTTLSATFTVTGRAELPQ